MQTLDALKPKRICAADDPMWLTLRNRGIGASEAPAACGVSDWCSPLELYYRKRGERSAIEENLAMRIGKHMEPILADEFEKTTGLKIAEREPGLYSHSQASWILATPDAILDAEQLLEIKTIGDWRAKDLLGEPFTDEIPYEWNVQAQQQMLVMDARVVWFAVLVGGVDFRVYEVQRHERLIDGIKKKVTDLWGRITTGNPPEMEPHRTNLELMRELYGEVHTGEIIELSEEGAYCWSKYEAHAEVIKGLKRDQDQYRASVLSELRNAEAGRLPDGRFVRRSVIHRKGYTVEPKTYVDVRAVSGKTY